MPTKEIKLISPNNDDIAGLLLEDGSICRVAFTYDKDLLVSDITLVEKHLSRIAEKDGESIYVDVKGQKWSASDVEYHSVLKS